MSDKLLYKETIREFYVNDIPIAPNFQKKLDRESDMMKMDDAIQSQLSSVYIDKNSRQKIFIVHGHNTTMLLSVKDLLRLQDIDPLVLKDLSDGGDTIIEKFERVSKDATYAIILCSADDLMENKSYRPRQNVIFE